MSELSQAELNRCSDAVLIAAQEKVRQRHPHVRAVVAVGSWVRGDATEFSDVDMWALGDSLADFELLPFGRRLLSLSGATPEQVLQFFDSPDSCAQAVPAWRGARVLFDPDGVAAALVRAAEEWDWDRVQPLLGPWAATKVTGLAEEAMKLKAALRREKWSAATVQATVIVMQLAGVVATRRHLLYETENRLWTLDFGDKKWGRFMHSVLRDLPQVAAESGLKAWLHACEVLREDMTEDQRAVVDIVRRA